MPVCDFVHFGYHWLSHYWLWEGWDKGLWHLWYEWLTVCYYYGLEGNNFVNCFLDFWRWWVLCFFEVLVERIAELEYAPSFSPTYPLVFVVVEEVEKDLPLLIRGLVDRHCRINSSKYVLELLYVDAIIGIRINYLKKLLTSRTKILITHIRIYFRV